MKGELLRAVLYTRVSTDEQAQNGTSLETQLDACRKKAGELGMQIVGEHEDAGISGSRFSSRPGVQAALRDLEEGRADALIVPNITRLSRDREHQSTIKKRAEAVGAHLVFCDMNFDDTPEGDLAFGIMGTFADYERKVIKERTMKGRRRRAEEGIQPCRNHSPFGYHVVSRKDVLSGAYPPNTLGRYQVLEEQAQLVREMFSRFAGGDSLRGVARWLTQKGVPTPRGGVFWNQSTLFRLIQHPVYKGEAPFGRFKRCHDESRSQRGYKIPYVLQERPKEQWICIDAPALVDEATWDICQQRMQQNKSVLRGRPKHKYLLTSLMLCPECNRKMRSYRVRHNPKNKESAYYHLYECRFARPSTNIGGLSCSNKQYRGYWAEPLVTHAIQEMARRPEMASAALEAYKKAEASEKAQPDIAQLQQQLADLQKQEQATVKAQIAGIMAGADTGVYEAALGNLAARKSQVTAVLARAGQRPAGRAGRKGDDTTIVTRAVAAVDEVLNAPDNLLTPTEKHGLLARVIEAIYPEGAKGLRIYFKPSLPGDLNVQYLTT